MKIRGSVVSLSYIFPHPPEDETYIDMYIPKVCLVVRMKTKSQHTASLRRQLVQHAYPDDGTALRDHPGELEFVQATRPQAQLPHRVVVRPRWCST